MASRSDLRASKHEVALTERRKAVGGGSVRTHEDVFQMSKCGPGVQGSHQHQVRSTEEGH